jgi:hypothetical protein
LLAINEVFGTSVPEQRLGGKALRQTCFVIALPRVTATSFVSRLAAIGDREFTRKIVRYAV